jgi:hypothetical protein
LALEGGRHLAIEERKSNRKRGREGERGNQIPGERDEF